LVRLSQISISIFSFSFKYFLNSFFYFKVLVEIESIQTLVLGALILRLPLFPAQLLAAVVLEAQTAHVPLDMKVNFVPSVLKVMRWVHPRVVARPALPKAVLLLPAFLLACTFM
jgi:hypothetical protein